MVFYPKNFYVIKIYITRNFKKFKKLKKLKNSI